MMTILYTVTNRHGGSLSFMVEAGLATSVARGCIEHDLTIIRVEEHEVCQVPRDLRRSLADFARGTEKEPA